MDEVGAALVDRVVPDVPVRQWVLSVPWELRLLCARRPEVMTALARHRERADAAQSLPPQPELRSAAPVTDAVPRDRDDEASSDAPDERAHDGLCSPFILTDEHLRRLLDGALLMTGPTATWAHLLRRSHDIDVGACPKCHGRLRLMAVVRDREQVRRFLTHLGQRPDPPPIAKARDPTFDFAA